MLKCKFLRLSLIITIAIVYAGITGCSSTSELGSDGTTENFKSRTKGFNGYKNSSELVSTKSLNSSSSKGNLESLTNSLTGVVNPSDLNYSNVRDELMLNVIEYFNTPYLWGGTSKSGIDCSAFVQTVMYNAFGIKLPRTSIEQSTVGETISVDSLQFGDLLFFDTMNKGRTTHVAIYLENGLFVHSGSKTGVAVANLASEFYSKTFLHAKRVLNSK